MLEAGAADEAAVGLVDRNVSFCPGSLKIVGISATDYADPHWAHGTMKVLLLFLTFLAPGSALSEPSSYESFLREEEALQNRFENGVMHVNGREFLLGDLHEWPKATHDFRVTFMVRSSIWLREFLDSDPILKHQDFEIHRTRDSSFTGNRYLAYQMALTPDPSSDCDVCHYELALDPALQVSGYDTYYNGFRSLLFRPKNGSVPHGFKCSFFPPFQPDGELSHCSVIVVYPFATNIVLNGYRYNPGTVAEYGPSFADIAQRMLEIVVCIDISAENAANQTIRPTQLLESNPNLTGCSIDLNS